MNTEYEKKTIWVRRKERWRRPEESYTQVDAYLVGGTEGVFAAWCEDDIIYLASGDDGGWWEIASYHKDWIPGILGALGMAAEL